MLCRVMYMYHISKLEDFETYRLCEKNTEDEHYTSFPNHRPDMHSQQIRYRGTNIAPSVEKPGAI